MKRLLIALIALTACGSSTTVVDTTPDTVALHPVHLPVAATIAMEPATIAEQIVAPVSAAETAVRVSAPDTTVPAPTTTVFTWVRYDCSSFIPLLEKYGLPVDWGLRIMQRESHCDPDVRCNIHEPCHLPNDDSLGLFQINTLGYLWTNPGGIPELCGLDYREQLFDPETNIRCAAELYALRGRAPWGT